MTITTTGRIDLYAAPDGDIGIDGCLPEAVAFATIDEAFKHKPSDLFVVQQETYSSCSRRSAETCSSTSPCRSARLRLCWRLPSPRASASVTVSALIWHRPVPR
jgi:hypothetical protein